MIAITTSSSTSVKPRQLRTFVFRFALHRPFRLRRREPKIGARKQSNEAVEGSGTRDAFNSPLPAPLPEVLPNRARHST